MRQIVPVGRGYRNPSYDADLVAGPAVIAAIQDADLFFHLLTPRVAACLSTVCVYIYNCKCGLQLYWPHGFANEVASTRLHI